jgi:hypothetical protein
MNFFELGFIEKATTLGISKTAAQNLIKRAAEFPEMGSLFKSLPNLSPEQENENPESLIEKIKQRLINEQVNASKYKIT